MNGFARLSGPFSHRLAESHLSAMGANRRAITFMDGLPFFSLSLYILNIFVLYYSAVSFLLLFGCRFTAMTIAPPSNNEKPVRNAAFSNIHNRNSGIRLPPPFRILTLSYDHFELTNRKLTIRTVRFNHPRNRHGF